MTSGEFIAKWRASELKERSAAQERFIETSAARTVFMERGEYRPLIMVPNSA